MKDYYDMYKLCYEKLDHIKLTSNLHSVFANRGLEQKFELTFTAEEIQQLKTYWSHFLRAQPVRDAPFELSEIIDTVNLFLKRISP